MLATACKYARDMSGSYGRGMVEGPGVMVEGPGVGEEQERES